jgi:glycosyltransferase involved in cell wall biosynthesis
MPNLVSVIIPCFNAQRWLGEAIESCLQQTYPQIEIIVIDDGSTDQSLDIIRHYGDRIIWERGPNQGGSRARNRGFALSTGDYIQYLDADDALLPEKIARQVQFLDETDADVVYEDWRFQRHLPDGSYALDPIQVTGPKSDFLESLLSDRGWVAPMALLFKRGVVSQSGGWDEQLRAGQDRDFFISVALSGARFAYQTGCHSIYRKYGDVTVSTSNRAVWLNSHLGLMQKAEIKLKQAGQLSIAYQRALAYAYFAKVVSWGVYLKYGEYLKFLQKIQTLDPHLQADDAALCNAVTYNRLQSVFGFLGAGIIYKLLKDLSVSSQQPSTSADADVELQSA